jgi:hypothetical protein
MQLSVPSVSPYSFYWRRKALRGKVPQFPIRRWWDSNGLCDIERVYFDAIKGASTLLDIGAGDLRMKHKLQRCGFRGEYDTQDVGAEFEYTYQELGNVRRKYDAVLCLDVIEHLPLLQGIEMLHQIHSLLRDRGVLVLQTPNARCIRNAFGTDITHVQLYNLPDLWTYLTCLGFAVEGYRVVFRSPGRGVITASADLLQAFVASRILGCDYADNIAIVATKIKQAVD